VPARAGRARAPFDHVLELSAGNVMKEGFPSVPAARLGKLTRWLIDPLSKSRCGNRY
jgi:hypothetical protein